MTGLEFYRLWNTITDGAFSDWLQQGAEFNRLAKSALIKSIFEKKDESKQKVYDELRNIVITEEVRTPTSNQVTLTDYLYLLNLKTYFLDSVSFSLSGATNSSPIRITLSSLTNLRSGSLVRITGVGGNTNANGDYYLKQIGDKSYQLYTDANLSNPVSGNGAYTSGGTLVPIWVRDSEYMQPREKIDAVDTPTVKAPRHTESGGVIKTYPLNKTCYKVEMDYIIKPTVYINSTDDIIDLELTYPYSFLLYVADRLMVLSKEREKDYPMMQTAQGEVNKEL